jgi:hypothetical protein
MTKIPKSERRLSAKERERRNKVKVFKTAVPLVVTLLLLGLVYVFVLVPVRPSVVLSNALYNSLDQTKQKSWRYDGSFGDKDSGFAAEYSGQKSSNGDNEFFIKFSAKGNSTSYHVLRKGTDSYYLVSGVEGLSEVLKTIPGAKSPDVQTTNILSHMTNVWIKVSGADKLKAEKLLPCSGESLSLPAGNELKELTGKSIPITITGGPYSTSDGSQSRVYEVGVKNIPNTTAYESKILSSISCIDSLRTDDFRLRKVNTKDIDILRFNITVDPLSNTLTKINYAAFSQYFQVKLRDYNKDVTITAPDNSVKLGDFLSGLDEQTKQDISQKTGLSIL